MQSHSAEEIAKVIQPQFEETDLETITTIVERYAAQGTWKSDLIFEEDCALPEGLFMAFIQFQV